MDKKPISKLAYASLMLNLLPLFITNILAVILGVIALVKIRREPNTGIYNMRGRSAAIMGIIFGCIIILAFLLFLPHVDFWPLAANETDAIGTLKAIGKSEIVWLQKDYDGNGIKDFWTYDVACLYRIQQSGTTNKVELIDISAARADAYRAPMWLFGKIPLLAQIEDDSLIPKKGYYFQAMFKDETGNSYNQNTVGTNKIKATNSYKYAFVAYPAVYGKTGIRTFIINESGVIYGQDTKGDSDKIILDWPGIDPVQVKGTDGKSWHIVE